MQKLMEYRQKLMEDVNEAEKITLSIGRKKYAARIAGSKLDNPFIWARHEDGHTIEMQITWQAVERMKAGELTNVVKH